jgi:hypothetical protein
MQGTIVSNAALAGVSIASTLTRTADIALPLAPETPLAAAKTGNLTTRTNNTDGVITAAAGHGLATSDVIDVYWAGGSRYGCTVSVSGNAVTISGGAGDNLPAQATDVTLCKQTILDIPDFAGDKLQMLAICMERRGRIEFREAAASALAREQAAGEIYSWAYNTGPVNPLAGKAVTTFRVTNGDATGTSAVKMALLLNS